MSGLFFYFLVIWSVQIGMLVQGIIWGMGRALSFPVFFKLWRVFVCVCYLHKRGSFLLVSGLCYLGLNLSGYQFLSCWWVSHPCLN